MAFRTHLPVFLPGNNRDWKEIAGLATISDDGEIHVKLNTKVDIERFVKMYKDGNLFCLAFDYFEPVEEKK